VHIIDSHFHWWPRSVFDKLCKRAELPRASVNNRGGYECLLGLGGDYVLNSWKEWYDLDDQFAHMDGLGHEIDVVSSIGPFSVFFSALPPEEGRDFATAWNEEMAGAQRKYPGRFWGSAAIPMQDTQSGVWASWASTCPAASAPTRA
jgi:aminocarboxymuconate-semialdehyde decarboxylase